MKKTSLYIDEDLDMRLAQIAESEGVPKAEVIRRALQDAVERAPRPRLTGRGVGHGPGDLAANADKYLEGFGDWRR